MPRRAFVRPLTYELDPLPVNPKARDREIDAASGWATFIPSPRVQGPFLLPCAPPGSRSKGSWVQGCYPPTEGVTPAPFEPFGRWRADKLAARSRIPLRACARARLTVSTRRARANGRRLTTPFPALRRSRSVPVREIPVQAPDLPRQCHTAFMPELRSCEVSSGSGVGLNHGHQQQPKVVRQLRASPDHRLPAEPSPIHGRQIPFARTRAARFPAYSSSRRSSTRRR